MFAWIPEIYDSALDVKPKTVLIKVCMSHILGDRSTLFRILDAGDLSFLFLLNFIQIMQRLVHQMY